MSKLILEGIKQTKSNALFCRSSKLGQYELDQFCHEEE